MLTYLVMTTPELTTTERQKYFCGRSADEQYELAQMLEDATPAQRKTIYTTLENWTGELCQTTTPPLN